MCCAVCCIVLNCIVLYCVVLHCDELCYLSLEGKVGVQSTDTVRWGAAGASMRGDGSALPLF